ncbi:MAG: ComF family protein [Roseateles depolymerans]|uniref:ComF family protein n=1 Tax=Roseateles depolymerans TaxID=76731 RepID=A0A2W5F5B3_9BURK|nr:MAG: ComF family protein [Roseateles depolymerans]
MPAQPTAASKPTHVERVLLRCGGQCSVCRSWSSQPVCDDCLKRYARPVPRCWTCAARLPVELMGHERPRCGACLTQPPPLDRCIAALDYSFPWDGLLQRFKYHQALDLRESLLSRLNQTLAAAQVDAPDWVLPVPLSSSRLGERGYNQAYELARTLARQHGWRCRHDLLLRVRDNEHQAGLSLQQRAANVRGVFAVEPLRAQTLRGARVALLDDVMTTGATLYELARVLRAAGVPQVQAWVVARTPAPGEPGGMA